MISFPTQDPDNYVTCWFNEGREADIVFLGFANPQFWAIFLKIPAD